ncbi:Putative ABC1 protein [Apostasia shenzhenica]|uniref:ABC1 protein n=1 Tax=Apostasia shenzhenica TaxID=1088818 RepID=A0A2I0A3D9_9ASPA|nr:Putative ABC1 protein [Apostasia shenzhenica]
MLRTGAKLTAGALALAGGAAAVAISTSSDDLYTSFRLCTLVPLRLLRDSATVAAIAFGFSLVIRLLPDIVFYELFIFRGFVLMPELAAFHLIQMITVLTDIWKAAAAAAAFLLSGLHFPFLLLLLSSPPHSAQARQRARQRIPESKQRNKRNAINLRGCAPVSNGEAIGARICQWDGMSIFAVVDACDKPMLVRLHWRPLNLEEKGKALALVAPIKEKLEYLDYEYSIWGLKEGSNEWSKAKHEAHKRCAVRLKELCFRNGGIYIKLGQHIGQLIFEEFHPVPLASASLAQVHAARTHDGNSVAVKVQHTHLTDTAIADIATVNLIVNVLHWVFPKFDYREMCLDNFRTLSPHLADYIYTPKVYWDLSSSKVLTMEYMDAAEITDLSAIERLGIKPSEVSKLVSQAFAEMIFRHGFVHCDPHAANMMIRPLPSHKGNIFGRRKPQLILLDHGLYKSLDFATRLNYASLWKALIFADVAGIKENSVKLGAGEDLYILFAGVLTMRPWNRVIDPSADHLVLEGNDSNRSELQYRGSSLDTFIITGRISSKAVAEAMTLSPNRSVLSGLSIWLELMLLEARLFSMKIALWLLLLKKALYG